jgi:hypothetical protein
LVIGGIAVLMMTVIALSGRNAPKERAAFTPPATSAVVDPNEARIREYRARIEEQARKLAAEQAQLAQGTRTLGSGVGNSAAGSAAAPYAGSMYGDQGISGYRASSVAQGQASRFPRPT